MDHPAVPASRTRLLALPGGLSDRSPGADEDLAVESAEKPEQPEKKPMEKPAAPKQPARPIPTPGEVFPRRKPAPPPPNPPQQLAAG